MTTKNTYQKGKPIMLNIIAPQEEKVIAGQSWNIKGDEPELLHDNWLWNRAMWAPVIRYGVTNPITEEDLGCDWPEAFQEVALEFINDRLPEGFEIHADGTMTFSHYTFKEVSFDRALMIAENAQWEAEYLDDLFDVLADTVRAVKNNSL